MDLEYITLSKVVSKHSKTLLKSCVMYHAIEYYHFLTKELKMVRALACLGDKTSYGKIITASASWYDGDRAIAQTGDRAICRKCNGHFPIFASAVDWMENGKAYVATGDRVLCGCSNHYVFGTATQYTSSGAGTLTTRDTSQLSIMMQNSQDVSSRNCIRFKCADDKGILMVDCRYLLILPDGHTETGNTDSQGMTEWHYAESAENINLHILMD